MTPKEEQENQGFKVNDRRRFQADGSPAEAGAEARAEGAKEENVAGASAETSKTPPEPAAETHEIPADFLTLLLSLAASAQSALGIAPHPQTGKVEAKLPEAKYSIDLLVVLQEKTRGNLTAEEQKFLEALLYDLRLRYVEAKGGS